MDKDKNINIEELLANNFEEKQIKILNEYIEKKVNEKVNEIISNNELIEEIITKKVEEIIKEKNIESFLELSLY